MNRRMIVAVLAAFAVLTAACASTPDAAPEKKERKTIGGALDGGKNKKKKGTGKADLTPKTSGQSGRGKIVLTVKDGSGAPRPWIQIRVTSNSGATSSTLETDFAGKARAEVTAGTWHANIVPGCQEKVNVSFAEGASLEVTKDGTAKASLKVEAVRRYMVSQETRWDIKAPWPDDKNVTGAVRWIDRCTGKPKPNDVLTEHVFVNGSERISVLEHAPKSDANGWVALTIYCNGHHGEEKLSVADRFNEADRVSLLPRASRPSGGWCA